MDESLAAWLRLLGPPLAALLLSGVIFRVGRLAVQRQSPSSDRRKDMGYLSGGLILLVWVLAAHVVSQKWTLTPDWAVFVRRLFSSAYVLAIFLFSYGFFPLFIRLGQKTIESMGLAGRQSLERVLALLIRVLVVIFGLSALLSIWGIQLAQLLTGLGIGSLAVALAAQNLLSNLIGGASLMLDRPFEVGESITVAGLSGKVEEIGWRSTRLRSFDEEWVSLPNAKLMDANIVNLSRMRKRRIAYDFTVRSESGGAKVAELCENLRDAIRQRPLASPGDGVLVNVQALSLDGYHIVVKYYIDETDLPKALQEKEALLLLTADWVADLGLKWPRAEWDIHSERNAYV